MSWWNDNFLFRRNIGISILDTIPIAHPVTVSIPVSILLGLNKVRSDLADIIVTFYNAATDTWTPLPTLATNTGTEIQIQFNTYLSTTSNNNSYYIYYGNKTLTGIPGLPVLVLNPWPLQATYLSNKVTYKHPGVDWNNGETTATGAKAAFIFSGTAVRLIAESGISDGVASLQLDTNPGVSIDFYRNGPEGFIDVYSITDLTPGYHVLRVINTGQRNSSATNTKIVIASFEYLGYIVATDLGEEINTLGWTTNTGGTT